MGVGYLTGQGGGGSNVKSIQGGTISISLAQTDVTINQVSLSNSIVLVNWYSQGTQVRQFLISAELATSTRIRITVNSFVGSYQVSWTVIEFNNVKSIQRGTALKGTASLDVSISSVDLNKSILFASATSTETGTSMADTSLNYYLSSQTNIVFKEFSPRDKSIRWQVIEFK